MGEGGSSLCNILQLLYKSFVCKELIGFLLALYMATLAKVACFCSLRGEIDFEDLLVLEKDA